MKDHPYVFITVGTCAAVFVCSLFILGIFLTAAH